MQVLYIIRQSVLSDKKNFILRINQDTFDQLEKWAADEFRSVNGQIEYLLHEALKKNGRAKADTEKPGRTKKSGN